MTSSSTGYADTDRGNDEPEFTSYSDMADEADRYCVELQGWLASFSSGPKKWPDTQIANKRRRLAWASKVAELCRRAAARSQA